MILSESFTYDTDGNLLTTVLPALAGSSGKTFTSTSTSFDYGHKTSQTDALGNTQT